MLKRVFGTPNSRTLQRFQPRVDAINRLEPEIEKLTDAALRARTDAFRERLVAGETLDDILVEAFATVREAAKRTLDQRHFDVQLLGGIILHQGQISEMRTGEGKTLVATLPVYLNALAGDGVHVVTVNDFLASRDAHWMGQIYEHLGLTVGCIKHGLTDAERQEQYRCDITYATNNELGFDYLRDNMKFSLEEMVQRPFNYAIVDEVDSILIDEARTPLIISGPTEESSEMYHRVDPLIPRLGEDDYETDEKQRTVTLTEQGTQRVEEMLAAADLLEYGSLYDIANISAVHHVNQALRAHKLFEKDRDYIVSDGKVVIIDEFTGRMMEGRRYSEGLHQAIEAKEGVQVETENQTLASITFQNYFRLYPQLAGMTGTAVTEASEFAEIYGLEVIEVPTNMPMIRDDMDDEVYRTTADKENAIVAQISQCNKKQQPVLVGTVSIEKSENLSKRLKQEGLAHEVLNARQHEQEAYIIAEAGAPGAITIATNMAGRGTDIQLGSNLEMRLQREIGHITDEEERNRFAEKIKDDVAAKREIVLEAGGLFVLGTERHESRRIDNQLRGRSGRQGDTGASKFFLSLEDDLMRIFGSERMDGLLARLGLVEGEAIIHPWINKALEKAQQKVEARNFDLRKQLLRFDDVMNDQRKVIYEQRREMMANEDISEDLREMRHHAIDDTVAECIPAGAMPEQWNIDALHQESTRLLGIDLPVRNWAAEEGIAEEELCERMIRASDEKMAAKAALYGPDVMRLVEKSLMLQVLDGCWKDHLLQLDHLRQGIFLRAYGQRDPLNEYKSEAFEMFQDMLTRTRGMVTELMSHFEISSPRDESEILPQENQSMQAIHETPQDAFAAEAMALSATGKLGLGGGSGSIPEGVSGGAPGFNGGFDPEFDPAQPGTGRATTLRSRAPESVLDPNNPTTWGKVPRNTPCPCGSGKKYKQCHGRVH